MLSLIKTTISSAMEAAITPLVAELASTRQTVQEQAETIGRVTSERDAAQAQIASILAAQSAPASSEARVQLWLRWWSLVLALAAVVIILLA
jgi:hypothetical protein